tara:strand:+ start:247 stop:2136 length:1890 start_codon:yes stop_codon:yes gene_type:complete
MNFMNRRMFQAGGASNSLGAYQIRDKVTGEVYDIKPDFINTPGFNPYKILSDSSLEKGSAVQTILEQFKEKDAPQIGPFQMGEDIGTNIADLGFGLARVTEPVVRGTSRIVGEVTGIQGLKDFGGGQKFDPTLSKFGGIDLFKPTYDSYVPSDEDRARAMLPLIKQRDGSILDPITGAINDLTSDRSSFDFRDEDMRSKVSQAEFDKFQTSIEPVFDPYNDPITPMLDDLSQQRINLEDRFAEENIQRPADVDVDEITSLLNDIQQPSINIDKTEADSLLETTNKFDGLSPDELKFELDKTKLPGMDSLDEQKDQVRKQVEVIETLESQGIDPDAYFNTARNPISKKLNEPGFFGSDRFLNFIRNVGAGLAESGQMGPGLVLGAAKAAEERAARDIAKDETDAEMAKLIAIEEAKAALEPGEQLKPQQMIDLSGQINADYNDVVSATNVLEVVDRVESIVLNEDTTSGKAIVKEFLTKVGSIFNVKTGKPDPNGVRWDKLDARTRARVLLNQITQKNIRDILGESGKTISNLDRQIVERLVGSLEAGKTDAEVLETLNETRKGITTNLQNASNRLKTNYTGMSKYGDLSLIGSPNISTFISSGELKDTIYSNQYASYSQPRTAITLATD